MFKLFLNDLARDRHKFVFCMKTFHLWRRDAGGKGMWKERQACMTDFQMAHNDWVHLQRKRSEFLNKEREVNFSINCYPKQNAKYLYVSIITMWGPSKPCGLYFEQIIFLCIPLDFFFLQWSYLFSASIVDCKIVLASCTFWLSLSA